MKQYTEQAAVKVSPEKFTWMKYKGVKVKILTHTKRNGDIVKTRLEPNDVFGYREVKQRSTGKELVQIVLKSDDMDLAYNLVVRSFNTHVLKHSKATVLPKKFKKPIDTNAIDKKAPAAPKVSTKAPKKGGIEEVNMRESKKDLGHEALNIVNDWAVPPEVSEALWGSNAHLQVKWDGSNAMAASIYVAAYDAKLVDREKTAGIKKLLKDRSRTGIYKDVVTPSEQALQAALKKAGLPSDAFSPVGSDDYEVKVFKSSRNPGRKYVRILIGYLNHIEDTPDDDESEEDREIEAIIQNVDLEDDDVKSILRYVKGTKYSLLGVLRFVEFVYDSAGRNTSRMFDDIDGFFSTSNISGIKQGLVIDKQGQPLINNFKNYADQGDEVPAVEVKPKSKPKPKKVDRTSNVEQFIREFMTKLGDGKFFNYTIDTNYSDRTMYSMTAGINEKPINLAYEQLMDEMKDTFGTSPKTVSEEVEERTFNSMIVKYEKTLNGAEFTQRLRKIKTNDQVKVMMVEFIFPT